jgi:PhzF family phenazine biosynthesis protein
MYLFLTLRHLYYIYSAFMKLKLYQIDAFTDHVFTGNPAAVCPLDNWLDDDVLLNIAAENNLAETAYFVKTDEGFHIRWFTPKAEVDLCGHATLASAYVIFKFLNHPDSRISFQSRSGLLTVSKNDEWYALNFPADKIQRKEITPELIACFAIAPRDAYQGISDIMLVFSSQQEIENIKPDLSKIAALPARGIIITARGANTDFVSRFFAPRFGIDEDPVTGSAHTTLTPYWSKQLGKTELTARQISLRGGYLKCKLLGERVEISGQGAFYLSGEITF